MVPEEEEDQGHAKIEDAIAALRGSSKGAKLLERLLQERREDRERESSGRRPEVKQEIEAVEMTRRIRDAHYEQLQGKSPDERIAFYRRKAQAVEATEAKRSASGLTRD